MTVCDKRQEIATARGAIGPYPEGRFAGRGIIICAGGPLYFTCAYVLVRMLREHLDCTLPIEIWYRGPGEMGPPMRAIMEDLGVTLVDAHDVRKTHPMSNLGGWELKPYALVHSAFEEVMLIDADNVPVRDPAFLFDEPEYVRTGALFWPDIVRMARDMPILEITGLEWRNEPSFESGQIVLDKRRVWAPLQLALHFNAQSDFYYQYVYGDKDTFYLAWRLCEAPFGMTPHPTKRLPCVLCQHDFAGELLFQHRNRVKWVLRGENPRIEGFRYHNECVYFIECLAVQWAGWVWNPPDRDAAARNIEAEFVEGRYFRYSAPGLYDRRLAFLPAHRLSLGNADELVWHVESGPDGPILMIGSGYRESARLSRRDGEWSGHRLIADRAPVNLQPAVPFDLPSPVPEPWRCLSYELIRQT